MAKKTTQPQPSSHYSPVVGGVYVGIDPGASGGMAAILVPPSLPSPRLYNPIQGSLKDSPPPPTHQEVFGDGSPVPSTIPLSFFQGTPSVGGLMACVSMPATNDGILDWLLDCLNEARQANIPIFAVLEKVGGYVSSAGGEGVKGQPGSAMFQFGASYGRLEMALSAMMIPYELVTPQRWQAGLHIPRRSKGEGKTEWKRRLRAVAERLYPASPLTNATADAILIATYCQRWREGRL